MLKMQLDELEALQDLYMFKALRVTPDVFEYVLATQYQVTIPCNDFVPRNDLIGARYLPSAKAKFKDDYPRLTSFFVDSLQHRIRHSRAVSIKQIVRTLADYYSSFAQIRTQLRHISIKYPVHIEVSAPNADRRTFSLNVTLLFPSVKGKASISLIFDEHTCWQWPSAIGTLKWDTNVVYGPIK
jgi:kinetochore protein Spc7/SPC105